MKEIFEGCRAMRQGHFDLASGRHSGAYLEKALIYPNTELVSELCYQMALNHHLHSFGGKIEAVVGPAVGGIVLSQWVAYHLSNLYSEKVLSIFTEKDENGKQALKRGYARLVAGKNVLIVDDIVTTGGSIRQVVLEVVAAGGTVMGIEVICNRGQIVSPFLSSLWQIRLEDWPQENCPLCQAGVPITKEEQ